MTAWLHVALAVLAYLVVAVLASLAVRRTGRDLADFRARTSPAVVAIGAMANLVVMAVVLGLLVGLDRRPLASLGLDLPGPALRLLAIGSASTVLLGLLYVFWLRRSGRVELGAPAAGSRGDPLSFLATLVVLAIVVAQEEVLYRGYVILDLRSYGAGPALLLSTVIFVAIHFATNRGRRTADA